MLFPPHLWVKFNKLHARTLANSKAIFNKKMAGKLILATILDLLRLFKPENPDLTPAPEQRAERIRQDQRD